MKRYIWSLLVSSVALALAACGAPANPTLPDPNVAVVTANPAAGNTSLPAAAQQAGTLVTGQITAISGQTLTIQDNRQQSTMTVTLTADSQVFKQASVALADIPVGATITALGAQSDSTFTAQQIRVGIEDDFAFGGQGLNGQGGQGGNPPNGQNGGPTNGGQPPSGGQPSADFQPNGTPPAGGLNGQGGPGGNGGPTNGGQRLTGTVEKATTTTLTVKTSDGTAVQVTLVANGQVTQLVAASQTDLVVGSQITASGTQSGTTFTVTRIQLLPAMQSS